MKIRELVALAETLLDPTSAEPWDAYGLQAGDPEGETERVLVTLDVTEDVLEEAVRKGCGLVMAHHPVLFHPTRELVAGKGTPGILFHAIRRNIAVYCAHTPLDKAEGGTGGGLVDALSLINARIAENCPYMRLGELPVPPATFPVYVMETLGLPGMRTIGRLGSGTTAALAPGSGGEFAEAAAVAGAAVFVTGEVKYHDALELAKLPMLTLEIGHDASEKPGVDRWKKDLQRAADMVSCNVVFLSAETRTQPYTWLQDERKPK